MIWFLDFLEDLGTIGTIFILELLPGIDWDNLRAAIPSFLTITVQISGVPNLTHLFIPIISPPVLPSTP